MAVELLGAKLIAPFYGDSLYVWTAVLGITILSLTLGYFLGGRLSEKYPSYKLLFTILAISSILTYFLPDTVKALTKITSSMDLIQGILLTSFLLLTPPLLCFGLVGPMVVTLLSNNIRTLGKTAGVVYFTSTSGGIVSTFLFGFFMIPNLGMRYSAHFTSAALISLPVLFVVKSFFSKRLKTDLNNADLRKISVQNSDIVFIPRKFINSWYFLAFLEGSAVMAVEMLAAKMISPYFGSSLIVWGTVIGMTFIALAIAYYIGGYLGDKYPNISTVYLVIMISSLFIMIMPVTAKNIIGLLSEQSPITSVVILSALLLIPTVGILGMTPTLLIRIFSDKIESSGRTTGNVFTVSSIGGIISVFTMGYWIIPAFGISTPTFVIGIITGIIPFTLLATKKNQISFIFIIFLVIGASNLRNRTFNDDELIVHYYSEGLLGQVLVADIKYPSRNPVYRQIIDRILLVNRMGQTYVNMNTGRSKWDYTRYINSITNVLPDSSETLLLGLGGGTVARDLVNHRKFIVDAVELDRRISDAGKEYFELPDEVNIIIDDARHLIETTHKKYDLIIFDVFKGENPPAHVLSKECFTKAGTLLKDNGLILVNFNGFVTGEEGFSSRCLYKTLNASGFISKVLHTPGTEGERNTLFVASKSRIDEKISDCRLIIKGENKKAGDEFFKMESAMEGNEFVFVDDKPNIEKYNFYAARKWREVYKDNYTRIFTEKGIPIFK
jgi:predicted membrane-bound spermidine synthase